MKHIFTAFLIVIYGVITSIAQAETGITVSVNLETAGTLSTVLRNQGTDFTQISKIVVTGKLNNKDLNTISTSMPIVTSIDISGTNATVIPDNMFKGKSQIQEFLAPATIRKIGNSAFENCNNLKTIPFSNQIDSIGNNAFMSCRNLTGFIVFPESFSYLGNQAFYYCNSLAGVDLSASKKLTSLNGSAFFGCSGLKKLILPSSLSYLGWGEFYSCSSLTSIDLSHNTNLTRLEGDLFSYCSALDTVLLPSSINYIGNVFSGCSSIKNITIMSKTPPQIESATFASVPYAYCKINVPIGAEQAYQKAPYWEYFDLFTGNGILPTIGENGLLKANGTTLKNGEVFFHEGKEVKLVAIPNPGYIVDSLTINDKRVTNLEDVVIPAGTVGAKIKIAFKLKQFNLDITVKGNGSIKYNNQLINTSTILALDSASFARFILRPDVDYVVDSLIFNGQACIVQQDSIFNTPQINANSSMSVSFVSASSMGSVYKISVSTGANGYVKYMNTPLLSETEVSVKKEETASFSIIPNATYIIDQVLCNGIDVTNTLVDNVFTTGALTGPSVLKVSFRINPTVTVTVSEPGTFSLNLTKDQCKEISILKVIGNLNGYDFLFIRDSLRNLSMIDLTDVSITEVAQSADWAKDFLPGSAFSGHTSLTQVLLPRGIKCINGEAFSNCTKLSSINLQDCAALTRILYNAFYNCGSLTTLHLPSSLTTIGSNAFYNCPNLTSITIDAVTPPALDPNAFNGTSMTLIKVPDQSLAAYKAAGTWKNYIVVSMNASSLTVNVATPGTLTAAIEQKGVNVTDVSNLIVTGTLNSEDFRVMNKIMTQLNTIDISQTSITEIPASAFEGKIQLLSFKSPVTIQRIGDKAFFGCKLLKEVPFGNQIVSIGASAFESCSWLDGNIVFPESFISIGSRAFCGCSGLDSVDMGKCKNMQQNSDYAFYNCSQLKSIVFPTSIYSIGSYAFGHCINLIKVDLSQCLHLNTLEGGAFSSCNSLKEVLLPSSITNILYSAFYNCSQLTTLKLYSSNIPSINSSAFSGVNLTTCMLYVPTGSAKSYGLASNWASFTNIKEMGIQTLVGNNGKVLLDGKEFNNGQVIFHNEKMVNLTIHPNPGYEIDVLKFNKQAVSISGDTYTVPAGLMSGTLEVSFKLKKFNLDITVKGNGSIKYNNQFISASTTLALDSASFVKFILRPDVDYVVDSLIFNDQACVVQQDSIFNTPQINANSSMSVSFVSASSMGSVYKISVSTGVNGYVKYMNSPLLNETDISVKKEERASFTIIPNATYIIDQVLYNGLDVTNALVDNVFTTGVLTGPSVLKVSFRINPIVTVTVTEPGTFSLSLTNDQCKEITKLKVNGYLNAYDFFFIRDSIKNLSSIDLTDVSIIEIAAWIKDFLPGRAFSGHTSLSQVLLPKGVKSINDEAFKNCTKLISINLQDCASLIDIGRDAFSNCASLNTLHLPSSLTSIGPNAFYYCANLTSITIDGVTPPSLDPVAFYGTPMTLIKVPDQSLAAYKAADTWKNYIIVSVNASSLTVNVATPGTLTTAIEQKGVNVTDVSNLIVTGTLNSEDFRVMNKIMTQLYAVDLSQTTITEIPASAFEGKMQLLSFKAPATIQRIGDKAFYGCKLLKELSFGDQIVSIGVSSFESCASLDGKIIFPESFISIGYGAFSGCSGIDSVDMGKCKNLQQISDAAFSNCTQLKSILFPTSINFIGFSSFSSCNNLSKVDLSQCIHLNTLEGSVFYSCNSLKEVLLPSSIYIISYSAFGYCSQLTTIKIYSSNVPSIESSAFQGVNLATCKLYVPTGSAKSYGLASNWASFTNIKEMGIQTLVGNNGKVLMDGKELNNGQVIFHNEKMVNLTINPNPGYEIDVLKFNKQAVSILGDTYTVPAGVMSGTLAVSFKLKKFGLTVTVDGLGSLKYNDVLLSDTIISLPVDSASSAKFIVLANEGYLANQIQFNGLPNVVQKGDSIYNTPFLTGKATLSVHFAAKSEVGISHKMDVLTGQNGYVEYVNTPLLPVTDVTINNATSAVFTMKPNNGYLLNKVLLNGTDVTSKVVNNQYTITSVIATGKLEISFKVNPVFSINVVTSGNLNMLLTKDQLKGVTNLTLSGWLNAQDFMLMRDSMEVLSVIDMRQATIFSDYMQRNDSSFSVIPTTAFSTMTGGKKTLTDIYLPMNTTVIGNSAFSGCSNLRFVNFEECTKLSTINSGSFYQTALKTIVLPASLKQLEQAFNENANLESVDLSATSLKTITSYCFSNCSKLITVILPVTIETIGNSCFQSCYALKSIDLSTCKALQTIGSYSFNGCQSLQTVNFPASLKNLGDGVFASNSALKSIDLSICTNLLSIEQSTFSSCNSLTSIKLPKTLQSIGVQAFYGCNILGTIELPATVKTIGNDAFNSNSRLSFCKIDATTPPVIGSSVFPSTMSAVFVPAESVVAYEAATGWQDYEIVGGQKIVTVNVNQPGTLATCIMDQTGVAPREITGMTVTGDLNAVDFENIRTNMQLLSTLDISGTDVLIIPEGAFRDKTILMNFVAPANLVEIKPHAFDNCSNLAVLNMPQSVMAIGAYAFNNCVSLNNVELSRFLMNIGDYAFNGCSSMDQVLALPTKLKNIGSYTFYGCASIKDTLFIPTGLETIGYSAFGNCNKISCVDMSTCANITNIPTSLFSGCTSLSTVKLSNIVRTISDQAFTSCSNLTNIHYPTSLSAINSYAFSNCAALKRVDLSDCKLLNTLGDEAFSNCTSLVTINLSPVLMNIGARAFSNNLMLANISSMNETPATLGDNTFYKVRTKKCVLSIPKNAYYTYLNASQWGSFVQMSKQVDVEIGEGGTVSFESLNPDSIIVNAPLSNVSRLRSYTATLSDTTNNESFGASLVSGARICVLDNQVLKFNIVPKSGVWIKKVMYNNIDVTSRVVDGVFMTPSVTANSGTISVTFDGDIIDDLKENIESKSTTKIYCISDVMHIGNENEMSGLEIFDVYGQIVYKTAEPNTSYSIDGLGKGMYIVRVYLSNKTVETLKAMKN